MARSLAHPARAWVALGAFTLLSLAASHAVTAAESADQVAAVAQVGFEDDADGFNAAKVRAGALFDYASELRHAGLVLQNTHYSTAGWSTDAPAIVGVYRNQRRDTLEGVRAEGGLVQVNGYSRVVGDATWSHRPRETTGVELILAGDLVGTRQALEEGIAYGLAGASIEQQFGHRFTAVAMAGWQPFTDGNARALLRARMIWSLLPEQGISAQLRWRQYSSSDADVGGAYFNLIAIAPGTPCSRYAGESVPGPWQAWRAVARNAWTVVPGSRRGWPTCARKVRCLAACVSPSTPPTATRRASRTRRTTGTAPPAST